MLMLMLDLWLQAETPGVTHFGAYHRPPDGDFLAIFGVTWDMFMDFPPAEGSNCQRAFEDNFAHNLITDFVLAILVFSFTFPNHLRTQVGSVGSNGFSVMAVHILNQVPRIQIQIQMKYKYHKMSNVIKCPMSNVMKYQMSWNVKCHEISWNDKCHEMTNVMK